MQGVGDDLSILCASAPDGVSTLSAIDAFPRFKHLSLNRKAVVVLVISSLVLSVLSSTIFFAIEYREAVDQLRADVTEKAEQLASDIDSSLVFLDEAEAATIIDRAMRDRQIHGISVSDINGQTFIQRTAGGLHPGELVYSEVAASTNGHTRVSVPVNSNGQQVGYLTLVYDNSGESITGAQYWRLLLIFLLSSFVVTAIILALMHRYTTQPIVELADFARRISLLQEHNERFPDDGRTDEIGTLTSAINDMLDTINEGQQRLQKHAGDLESLVALRTEQLNKRANFDQLTGLPNRYQLMDRMKEMLGNARAQQQRLALILIDLDRFKNINDSLGHHAGDVLLREVSKRIIGCLTNGEFFARLGGDEFVVIIPNLRDESAAIEIASRLMDVIGAEIQVEALDLRTSASMGISIYPDHGTSASELLKCADISMYSSKETGRATFSVYSSMMATHTRRLELETALAGALDRGEFELVYQPQIEFFSGQISGFEALLRWNNEELDNPPPDEFIPIAAETSYIHEITRWVVETAAHDLSLIQNMGLDSVSVAVNVSPSTLYIDGFESWIVEAMKKNELKPGSLEIEITEDIFLSKSEDVFDLLKSLQSAGVRIAIDDFGTRFSSLLYLVGYPLDTLKIDSQFIAGIETSNKHRNVVAAMVSLAHGLGLRVIAEGVEVDAQRQFLRVLGCDLMQGYLLHEPASCRDIVKRISPDKSEILSKLPASG